MTVVVKVGGAAPRAAAEVAAAAARTAGVAVVHGAGPQISDACRTRGIEPRFVDGQRVTDAAVLDVVREALATHNARLVAGLRQAGVPATSVVGALVAAPVNAPALGLVGRVTGVDGARLRALLADGRVPVVSPFAGLNVNADHAAAAVAVALEAEELVFVSDVPGVLDAGGGVIPRIAAGDVPELVAAGTVGGGMLPKLAACLRALDGGVGRAWIGSETAVTA